MNKLHLKFVFILSGMSNLPLELRMRSNKVQPSNTHINLNCHVWPKKGIDTGQCWKQIRLRFRHCWIWLINAKQRMNYNYNTIEFCKLRVLKASGSSCLEEPSPGATLLPANETNPLCSTTVLSCGQQLRDTPRQVDIVGVRRDYGLENKWQALFLL